MKFLTSLVFIFIINICHSQIKSGEVIYNVKKNSINISDDFAKKDFNKIKDLIENKISEIEFVLKFNRNESIFEKKIELLNDYNDDYYYGLALIVTRANKLFYANSKNKKITESFSFLGKKIVIETDYKDLDWTLLNESKKIENYVCFKAILEIEKESISKKRKIKYRYVAWYCPELSFNFGPFEGIGLPGLVLEFSTKNHIYFAHKITLKDSDIVIKEPKDGELMTRKEYNQLGKKAIDNRGK